MTHWLPEGWRYQVKNQLITHDYQGMAFSFREDGYFNMTKAAAHFGKRLDSFLKSPDTQEYMAALTEAFFHDSCDKAVIETKRGSGLHQATGTYGHPKLAIFFARWLDVRFSVWCDSIIEDILRGNAELNITKPEESATVKASALPGVQDLTMNTNNQVSTFDFCANTIRVVTIEGNPWFVAKDVCEVLNLGWDKTNQTYKPAAVCKSHLDSAQIGSYVIATKRGGRAAITISESGLYKLIMRSDKPMAKGFQDWVTKIVLPAIRKDGAYIQGEEKITIKEPCKFSLTFHFRRVKALTSPPDRPL